LDEEFKIRRIKNHKKFNEILKEQMHKTTFHYGHPYLNKATMAGVFRMAMKKYEEINANGGNADLAVIAN